MEEKDFVLDVKDLKITFKVGPRRVHAVNDVTFSLRRGKTLCVVGESGCGKSVTAQSIMQLLPKNGILENGSVTYYPEPDGEGKLLSAYPRSGKEIRAIRGKDIAMIFQDPMSTLNPVYTIGSQIMENLRSHEKLSKADARERIIRLLADLGIPTPEQRFGQYPHEFSGGMKQRVMIAIAMICNPTILIADEPTTALDVTIQAQILDLMRKMQQEHGTSILLITHNMGIVAEIADDVAVMYMGRVVEFGSLEQIFTNPVHPYTKALMRSVPVLGMNKDQELQTIEGSTPDASTVFTGCEFAERCEFATEACKLRFPVDTVLEEGHRVRCLLFEEAK
ncbi:MAG: ABC transporter ATP-binding protein [Oscillospiraceae bacterium]|nr:ABC transporter ATP-binding protein [Oscillospiraceae bacterium]